MSFLEVYTLQNELGNLQADAEVRRLLSLVAQNPQDETIDLEASAASVVEKPMSLPTKLALFSIRKFLLGVLYWTVSAPDSPLSRTFLYENHTRLQKLLVVAKLLDHVNLQSFGTADEPVYPMVSDIPLYGRLWTRLASFRQQALLQMHQENKEELQRMPEDFRYLCPVDDRAAFRARGERELASM